MAPARTYPRIDGPKRQPDGTYLVLVYRTADDLERIAAPDLAAAQQTIAFLQKAKTVFTPSEEKVLARTRGRKPKLTPEVHKAIVESIAQDGASQEIAAQAAGICESTFYVWMRKGRDATDENDIYFQFMEDIEVAQARHECTLSGRVTRSADYDWRAAMALLQHHKRYRARWSKHVDEDTGEGVTVVFHRPEMDPNVKSDDLVAISDVQDIEDGGNGKGNGDVGDS